MKLTGAGVATLSLAQLGFNLKPAYAYAAKLKIEGAKEVLTVCPFCAVSCHIVAYVKNNKLVGTEGDPDHPVNEGALCAKGAALLTMARSEHRLKKPSVQSTLLHQVGRKILGMVFDRNRETNQKNQRFSSDFKKQKRQHRQPAGSHVFAWHFPRR